MKALLHTGDSLDWLAETGQEGWSLLPLGNRPLLEYWFEVLHDLGIKDVWVLLGDDAHDVEQYAGDGSRWGLDLHMAFLREGTNPDTVFKRKPELWQEGVFYLRAPCFPRRQQQQLNELPTGGSFLLNPEHPEFGVLTDNADDLEALIRSATLPQQGGDLSSSLGIRCEGLPDANSYFQLNMALVNGEIQNYLTPGYSLQENSHIGYNVITPPSCNLEAPLMVGNDCRLRPLCSVGPRAVIGNNVVIDGQSELRDCVILDGTYVGRNLEIENKIVAGRHMIDPESGVTVSLDDPLLLAEVGQGSRLGDLIHVSLGKIPATLLWLLMAPFYLMCIGLFKLTGSGSFQPHQVYDRHGEPLTLPELLAPPEHALTGFFRALNLDRWPALGACLKNQLYLCGHLPVSVSEEETRPSSDRNCPAVFCEELLLGEDPPESLRKVYARQYCASRAVGTDLRILARVLMGRVLLRSTLTLQEADA